MYWHAGEKGGVTVAQDNDGLHASFKSETCKSGLGKAKVAKWNLEEAVCLEESDFVKPAIEEKACLIRIPGGNVNRSSRMHRRQTVDGVNTVFTNERDRVVGPSLNFSDLDSRPKTPFALRLLQV